MDSLIVFVIPYSTKIKKLPGTNYQEVKQNVDIVFKQIKSKTKRRPYVRSLYFKKQKVFFDFFWQHLFEKSHRERVRRLKFFPCAIDLIRNSKIAPTSKENVDKPNEILHRFVGQTKDKEIFFVQIKEDKRSGKKYLMSCFPLGR